MLELVSNQEPFSQKGRPGFHVPDLTRMSLKKMRKQNINSHIKGKGRNTPWPGRMDGQMGMYNIKNALKSLLKQFQPILAAMQHTHSI